LQRKTSTPIAGDLKDAATRVIVGYAVEEDLLELAGTSINSFNTRFTLCIVTDMTHQLVDFMFGIIFDRAS
jgi:hypothetical protein